MKPTILGLGFLLAISVPLRVANAQTEREFPTPSVSRSPIEMPFQSEIRIPPQSAIFVTPSTTEAIDVGRKQHHPLMLTVTQPVFDVTGDIGIPVGSKIDARLIPLRKEKMALIEAKHLVMGSRIFPIQAKSDMMPSERISLDPDSENGCRVGGRITPDVTSLLGESNGGSAVGGSIAIDCSISIFSSDRFLDLATFTAGKEYLLVLENEATLPNL